MRGEYNHNALHVCMKLYKIKESHKLVKEGVAFRTSPIKEGNKEMSSKLLEGAERNDDQFLFKDCL